MIDRNRVKKQFEKYTNDYDAADEKIKLKINHTYRVAELCEQIARAEGLPANDTDLAWLLGMLHDIGRFEQLRRYGTFVDAESIDHAQFGADILFNPKKLKQREIRSYLEDSSEDALIEAAIRVHSAYKIPEVLNERTVLFCNILRDADKIDILKVNVEVPLEAIYNVTTEELRNCRVSDAVMKEFFCCHAILRSLRQTPVDNIVGHIALVYELVFPISAILVQEQGYLDVLLDFESDNPITKKQFEKLREQMMDYLGKICVRKY